MNTRALFPLLFTVASFSASAGNWAVKNGWCQTMTEDGQALVMLKNGTIGITGLMQGCPNGVQTLLGSRISINGNLIPTSQMCNQQTGFRAVEVEIGQAPEMVKKAVFYDSFSDRLRAHRCVCRLGNEKGVRFRQRACL